MSQWDKGGSVVHGRRRKKYPSLTSNLLKAIRDLCKDLGICFPSNAIGDFVEKIRRDNNVLADVTLDSQISLAWTKEKGGRKLFLICPLDVERIRPIFDEWRESPQASLLQDRGIFLGYNRYTMNSRDIFNAADEDTHSPK